MSPHARRHRSPAAPGARHRRIKTAVETCGCVPWETLKEAAQYLNYVLFDVKQMDSEKHREGTGVGNELILSNLKKLITEFPNLHVQVRTPVIPGFNDNDEFAHALANSSRAMRMSAMKPCPTTVWEPRSTTS